MQANTRQRRQTVFLALGVEGGLAALAWVLGRVAGRPPLGDLHWDEVDAGVGVAASLPLLVVALLLMHRPWRPLVRIRQFFDEVVRPFFEPCTVLDLALVAVVAGIGEEMLFRGVFQAALCSWLGLWMGLLLASAIFGLAHLITPTYAIVAALIGVYLGGLWIAADNLLAPMITHAVYDFVALVYLLRIRTQTS